MQDYSSTKKLENNFINMGETNNNVIDLDFGFAPKTEEHKPK